MWYFNYFSVLVVVFLIKIARKLFSSCHKHFTNLVIIFNILDRYSPPFWCLVIYLVRLWFRLLLSSFLFAFLLLFLCLCVFLSWFPSFLQENRHWKWLRNQESSTVTSIRRRHCSLSITKRNELFSVVTTGHPSSYSECCYCREIRELRKESSLSF